MVRFIPWVALGLFVATFWVLLGWSGSLCLSLTAIVAVALTATSTLGVSFGLLANPAASKLLGLAGPLNALPFPALVLALGLVFGLTLTNKVLLAARLLEAHRQGLGAKDALERGLAVSGGVSMWACVLMCLVFGGALNCNSVTFKVVGLALAAGCLLDIAVIRTLLLPGLLAIAGKWTLWPGNKPR